MESSRPAESYPVGKGERHRIFRGGAGLGVEKKETACLGLVEFGAIQFVDRVAAAGVDYIAVVEHGGGVAGARVAHAPGRAPCTGRWVIEFGAGQRRGAVYSLVVSARDEHFAVGEQHGG